MEKEKYVDEIIRRYLNGERVKIDWAKIDMQDLTPDKIKILNQMVGARNLADFIKKIDYEMYKVISVLRKNGFSNLLPGGVAYHKDDDNFFVYLDDIDRTCYFYRQTQDGLRILNVNFDKILYNERR